MNIFTRKQPGSRRSTAFTLPEMMIVMAIFSLVVAAMVSLQLFAARIYLLAGTKISATTDGRKTLNAMRDSIRGANVVMVGSFISNKFTQVSNTLPQVGSALAIQYTNAGTTNMLIFYKDQTDPRNVLCEMSNSSPVIIAKYITNSICFQAEDYQGNILTNYQNNPVIRINLQFSQWEYPIAVIGSNSVNAYDFYQLRTRIARREK
jgi:prepilin-type N-terminal cleavage/methylation domain-containing protein